MAEYTAKERKVVNDAWDYAIHIADLSTHFKWDLFQALKHERKERQSATIAKCIILGAIEDQLRKPGRYRICDLSVMCQGGIVGHIIGDEWRRMAKHNGQYDKMPAQYREHLRKLLPKLAAVRCANQSSTDRILGKVL